MRPDLLLQLLAEQTGERIFALDQQAAAAFVAREPAQAPQADKVAVLPLQGVLSANGVRFFGRQMTPGMNTFRQALAAAVANPEVGAIVLDVDSPGGTVAGTPETAAAVKAAAAAKPVYAFVDTVGASAAYWIASQAGQVWMNPSAEVGSIGVMGTHISLAGALEREGVAATTFRSGVSPYKNEASPFEPLSEEAAAAVQARVDELGQEFVATVAKGRKTTPDQVEAAYGKGRMLGAQAALAAGMVDKIGSVQDLLASLRTSAGTVRRRYSAFAFD